MEEDFFEYLTYSKADEKWQIVCTDIGRTHLGPHAPYPFHSAQHPGPFRSVSTGRVLSEYQIVYVTKGFGVFASDTHEYRVGPGCFFLIFPGKFHRYNPDPETGWDEWWLGFRGPLADMLCAEKVISEDKPFFEIGIESTFLGIFDQIFRTVKKQEPLYQAQAGALIFQLLSEIVGHTQRIGLSGHSSNLVEQAKHSMNEKVFDTFDLSEFCKESGVSLSHLGVTFKAYTGMSPYQYFITIKLNKAKEFLQTKEFSIKEIAFKLGFQDQYYFSRLFKKKTGISPSHYGAV